MAPKRPLPPPEEAEDGGRSRALKRWRPLVLEVLGEQHMQRLLVEIEKVLRRVVREELMRLHANHVYQPRLVSNQDKEIRYRLHFQNKLPKELFTFNTILAEDGMSLQIALMDSNLGKIITSDPVSSVKVEIVVIYGDFVGDRHEYWTEKQFMDHVVPQRDGKGPLLAGKLVIKLNKGVGYLADATFKDNSSWTRSQMFRLGVRLSQSECLEDRVQEGISEPFRVKDRRVKSNQKSHCPSLTDEVWRLKHIMKGGKFHQRLVDGGIHTVQQFLQAFTMNHEGLRSLLGDKAKKKEIRNKKWQEILTHAQKCPLGNELYLYSVPGQNVMLIFNSIYELIGALIDGSYYSMGDLTAFLQKSVDNWKKLAFENPKDIHIMVDNLPQPITPINVPSVPGSSSLDPQIPYSNDEATTQVGLWHQPNVPHNEHSNVLFGPEDNSAVANRVRSIPESSSFQEPEVSNGLSVCSIPVHLSAAIDTAFPGPILPEPQNSDHPTTYIGNEPAMDMGFQQPRQDMTDDEGKAMFLEYWNASWTRKWVKMIAGLKCGLSISKDLAARRTRSVHLSVETVMPSSCLGTLGAGY